MLSVLLLAACAQRSDSAAATESVEAALTQIAETASAMVVEATQPPSPTAESSPTAKPSETPLPLPTATPGPAVITSKAGDIACLFGPGTEYALGGTFLSDDEALVLAKTEDGTWYRIEHPRMERRFCWLSASETDVRGNIASIEIAPPPDNIVTGIFVDIAPSKLEVDGCSFPAKFDVTFTIQTTGPVTVRYRTVSDEGASGTKEVEFKSGEAKSFTREFSVSSEGEHWYRVEVVEPNSISSESTARAVCP
jgi:hypothetical protein